jgi:hypothetical protein
MAFELCIPLVIRWRFTALLLWHRGLFEMCKLVACNRDCFMGCEDNEGRFQGDIPVRPGLNLKWCLFTSDMEPSLVVGIITVLCVASRSHYVIIRESVLQLRTALHNEVLCRTEQVSVAVTLIILGEEILSSNPNRYIGVADIFRDLPQYHHSNTGIARQSRMFPSESLHVHQLSPQRCRL